MTSYIIDLCNLARDSIHYAAAVVREHLGLWSDEDVERILDALEIEVLEDENEHLSMALDAVEGENAILRLQLRSQRETTRTLQHLLHESSNSNVEFHAEVAAERRKVSRWQAYALQFDKACREQDGRLKLQASVIAEQRQEIGRLRAANRSLHSALNHYPAGGVIYVPAA